MKLYRLVTLIGLIGLPQILFANALTEDIDPQMSYVFYLHGYIVEGDDPTPKHSRWGVYDFPAIKTALMSSEYQLTAEHRPKNTDPFDYAQTLADKVNKLIENGVPANNISIIGFSRGGLITAITSSKLANKDINFAILAACTSGLGNNPDIMLHGHILSIYETTDSVGSCDEATSRNPETIASYKEISISTGKEHGAFYQPIAQWVLPVKRWLLKEKREKHITTQ